jgi:hypothetical protein
MIERAIFGPGEVETVETSKSGEVPTANFPNGFPQKILV